MDGTSDARAHRALTDNENSLVGAIKDRERDLRNILEAAGASRELSIAKTKLEEAVMWAVKHITR